MISDDDDDDDDKSYQLRLEGQKKLNAEIRDRNALDFQSMSEI
jgi:hypothetical protein